MYQQNPQLQRPKCNDQNYPTNEGQPKNKNESEYQNLRSGRIFKLKQILMKNDRLRKKKQSYNQFSISWIVKVPEPTHKNSFPCIPGTIPNKNSNKLIKNLQNHCDNLQQFKAIQQKYGNLKSQIPLHKNSKLDFQKNVRNRSFLKLKVKNLDLQENKDFKLSYIQNQISILEKQKSFCRLQTIQRLAVKEHSRQKQEKKSIRRKKRNLSQMNLAKIEHLPQIIFQKSKKCQKIKSPSSTMAQIDGTLIANQISLLEQKCLVQKKKRQTDQKIFKMKTNMKKQKNKKVKLFDSLQQ